MAIKSIEVLKYVKNFMIKNIL